jgi:hypothetical protein
MHFVSDLNFCDLRRDVSARLGHARHEFRVSLPFVNAHRAAGDLLRNLHNRKAVIRHQSGGELSRGTPHERYSAEGNRRFRRDRLLAPHERRDVLAGRIDLSGNSAFHCPNLFT